MIKQTEQILRKKCLFGLHVLITAHHVGDPAARTKAEAVKECCVLPDPVYRSLSLTSSAAQDHLPREGTSHGGTSTMNQENAPLYFPQANPHRGSWVMSQRVSEVASLSDSSCFDQVMKLESRRVHAG